MVKGVNKSVIEMNCLDGGYFERAILFVSPEYSHLSSKRIEVEAKKFISSLDSELPSKKMRGERPKNIRWRAVALSLFISVALLTVALLIFNKLEILWQACSPRLLFFLVYYIIFLNKFREVSFWTSL